jgi:two-component system, NarL family, sensor histidine kinase UhpB
MTSSSSSAGLPTAAESPDRPAPVPADRRDAAPGLRPPPGDRVSLLWRVFAANIVVSVIAVALLAWTPATVHRVATPGELLVLAIGLAVMLAVDLLLLRRAFAPLRRLAAVMSAVDPAQPGRRAEAPESAGREVVALANALNAMLDRLEGERRESARRTLEAQEGERKRIARELHDEVGQTLTAIALRAERAA